MPAMPVKRPGLVQVSVTRSVEEQRIIPAYCSNLARRDRELQALRKHLRADGRGAELAFGIQDRISPHLIAMSNPLFSRVKQLHILLARVFVDIVDRWFTDEKARFPERMPLEPSDEALLKWVINSGCVPDYPEHAGCWRSDVLFGRSSDGLDDESPYICEINGRLPLNAVMGIALGANGYKELGASNGGIEIVNSMEDSYGHVMAMFDPDKPLFSIRDKWPGADSKLLSTFNAAQGRQSIDVVRPQDLELRPDDSSPTGSALWDKATNTHLTQWFAEMLQDEWEELDTAVARQLSLTPLNDLRTVFIVHDKRLLGIIPEELPNMVARGVLTAEEAEIVASGIIETINPGSTAVQKLLRESIADPNVRKDYIYKPCRDGMGKGIDLGRNLSQEDWLERLEKLANPDVLRPHQDAAVIQRLVDHYWYDLVRHEVPSDNGAEPNKFHLIGSMFMFQSRRFLPGTWRMGLETHLGIASDKPGLVMAMAHQPDWPVGSDQEKES
ncbi:hypothetical protein FSARC_7514 [Fusarium sarcochroum]|uniref:Uncharacterized protein n=1 Tax=Fusarium sarcochroum TaxID=1208366 RepID=A0A8H4X7C0_9HYPO|nr:hypothetical protein FSARC_7514 [Fusarium sarcochroum]